MLIIKVNGRLGNQLFVYAYGQALAARFNQTVRYDFFGMQGTFSFYGWCKTVLLSCLARRRVPNLLKELKIAVPEYSPLSHGRFLLKARHVEERRQAGTDNGAVVAQAVALPGSVYLDGFWQNQTYFLSNAAAFGQEIRSLLKDLREADERAFSGAEAVCVHIRRGDYVHNPITAESLNLCGPGYFSKAMEAFERKSGTAWTYYIFSDDIAWCRVNMRDCQRRQVFIEGDAGRPERDLALMASCRHFIISNSSYSWWAAWLGAFPDKVVVCPEKWMNSDTDYLAPQCPEWIKVGTGDAVDATGHHAT